MAEYLYFFINYPRDKEENPKEIYFEKKSINPECIFTEYEFENKKYNYKKIFKFKSSEKEKYKLEFVNGEDRYIISFPCHKNTFIYDVTLEKGLNIIAPKRKNSQNRIEYKEKMNFFIKALQEKKEEDKVDLLFKDTIDLYSKKKGFNFLIPLFLKIYKKKDLCKILLEKFLETDEKSKINNMDRNAYLSNYTSQFNIIVSEAEKLIKDNDYKEIQFYGIILCYLNFYDEENFSKLINDLYMDKSELLYEIMLTYRSHFLNPINLDFCFFNKFINYSIKKKKIFNFSNWINLY